MFFCELLDQLKKAPGKIICYNLGLLKKAR